MGSFVAWYLIMLICGALIGLIPFGIGRYLGKPRFGQLGLIFCAVSALIHPALPLPVAIGFIIAMFIFRRDLGYPAASGPVWQAPRGSALRIQLICLAGPLKGQVYAIGSAGLTIGRDNGCGVRLPGSTPGISRCHCCIRFQQGQPVLVDLDSAYGTFQGNGTRLPPNYPMQLVSGSRFYLGSPNILFEVRYY